MSIQSERKKGILCWLVYSWRYSLYQGIKSSHKELNLNKTLTGVTPVAKLLSACKHIWSLLTGGKQHLFIINNLSFGCLRHRKIQIYCFQPWQWLCGFHNRSLSRILIMIHLLEAELKLVKAAWHGATEESGITH